VAGEVKFENVTCSYVPGVPVLKDVSIQARPGERIALVGHTGAGKRTLVNFKFLKASTTFCKGGKAL